MTTKEKKDRLYIQSEPKLQAEAGSVLYFNTERPLDKGDKIDISNEYGTITAKMVVIEKSGPFYKGIQISQHPVENRLDLTHIV